MDQNCRKSSYRKLIVPGYEDSNAYCKVLLQSVLEATKAAVELPGAGSDFEFYRTFEGFRTAMSRKGHTILSLMSSLKHNHKNITHEIFQRQDLEENFKLLVDVNDEILENVDNNIRDALEQELFLDMNANSATNNDCEGERLSSSISTSTKSYKLRGTEEILKPQLPFNNKIDNFDYQNVITTDLYRGPFSSNSSNIESYKSFCAEEISEQLKNKNQIYILDSRNIINTDWGRVSSSSSNTESYKSHGAEEISEQQLEIKNKIYHSDSENSIYTNCRSEQFSCSSSDTENDAEKISDPQVAIQDKIDNSDSQNVINGQQFSSSNSCTESYKSHDAGKISELHLAMNNTVNNSDYQTVIKTDCNMELFSSNRSKTKSYESYNVEEITKPQLAFKDKIDNSDSLFVPLLKEKPNSFVPLVIFVEDDGIKKEFCHPYKWEILQFNVPEELLVAVNPTFAKPTDQTPLVYVDTEEQLKILGAELKQEKEFAVDLEYHSFRSYQGFTCLVQISTRDKDYIVDAIELRNELHVLNSVFTDPKILKVFHGSNNDVLWLQKDLGIYVVNLFDTGQAARILGFSEFSLVYLLKHYCNIELGKEKRLGDWRSRPLSAEMTKYAREDTHYLLYAYDRLRNDLIRLGNETKNLIRTTYEKSKMICLTKYKKPAFKSMKYTGVTRRVRKGLNKKQLFCCKYLHEWRDKTAREHDESLRYVLPTEMLLRIAKALPEHQQDILKCCNPIPPLVRQQLHEIHSIVLNAKCSKKKRLARQEFRQKADNFAETLPKLIFPYKMYKVSKKQQLNKKRKYPTFGVGDNSNQELISSNNGCELNDVALNAQKNVHTEALKLCTSTDANFTPMTNNQKRKAEPDDVTTSCTQVDVAKFSQRKVKISDVMTIGDDILTPRCCAGNDLYVKRKRKRKGKRKAKRKAKQPVPDLLSTPSTSCYALRSTPLRKIKYIYRTTLGFTQADGVASAPSKQSDTQNHETVDNDISVLDSTFSDNDYVGSGQQNYSSQYSTPNACYETIIYTPQIGNKESITDAAFRFTQVDVKLPPPKRFKTSESATVDDIYILYSNFVDKYSASRSRRNRSAKFSSPSTFYDTQESASLGQNMNSVPNTTPMCTQVYMTPPTSTNPEAADVMTINGDTFSPNSCSTLLGSGIQQGNYSDEWYVVRTTGMLSSVSPISPTVLEHKKTVPNANVTQSEALLSKYAKTADVVMAVDGDDVLSPSSCTYSV